MPQRSARTAFVLLIVVTVSAAHADAQTAGKHAIAPGIWNAALASIEAGRLQPGDWPAPAGKTDQLARAAESRSRQSFARSPRHRGAEKAMGAIAGALGGFLAGGLIGASLDRHCGCDDPGVNGFVIGAPIGAIAGGVLGFALAGR